MCLRLYAIQRLQIKTENTVRLVPTSYPAPVRDLTTVGSLADVPGVYDCMPSDDCK